MLRNPQHSLPAPSFTSSHTHINFTGSNLARNGGPYRTKGGPAHSDYTVLNVSTHPHLDASTSSLRYSPYAKRPARTGLTPPPTTHSHSPTSFDESSTLHSHFGSVLLSTSSQQSNLLCGVHTSASLPLYRSEADRCLPQIQVRYFLLTFL